MSAPPLPPGWSEHPGPNGVPYYYNAQLQQSTYVRPIVPAQPPSTQVATARPKERPIAKIAVPGTDWLRIRTSEGNLFYMNKTTKQSVWTVPPEIKDAVQAMEKLEKGVSTKNATPAERKELARILAEVQDATKRKAEEPAAPTPSKKAKVEDAPDEEGEEEDESDDENEEEVEDWEKEAAAQLAKEAEIEKAKKEEEARLAKQKAKEEAAKEKAARESLPEMSLDEAKAMFKTLLREKDVNPLHPWDMSLPVFVNDPRYILLPSVSIRREVFDEYCRERAREIREQTVKKEKEAADPKEEFDRLLQEHVKSTRTTWNDFRRDWKKTRQFYGWGRDDREREKRFKAYLKELGEKKKAAAQEAEKNFFALLKESGLVKPYSVWKEVKPSLYKDPRYDAVGSSSLREELFNTYLKASGASGPDPTTPIDDKLDKVETEEDRARARAERKERAVKEREERVRAERDKVNAEIDKSRMGLNREEGELLFRTMLTDAIRDPQLTWDTAKTHLSKDPRFTQSPLPVNHQQALFHAHISQLRAKQMHMLYALFEANAPSLAMAFSTLNTASLLQSPPAVKLGFDAKALQHEFEKWQRERTSEARRAFDEMLKENSFVEFWGRLGKIGGEGVDGGVKAEETEEDEGEGGGGKVDMKVLAKNIDVGEMVKVVQNDKRYIMFDHIPEQRIQWLRDYLSQQAAPDLSVHAPHK